MLAHSIRTARSAPKHLWVSPFTVALSIQSTNFTQTCMLIGTHVAGTVAGSPFNFDPVANPDLATGAYSVNYFVTLNKH